MAGPEYSDGEHTFEDDILLSGKEMRGYTAAQDLTRGEPVEITGNNEVAPASNGGPFAGVALYSVAAGEEVAIAGDDCEVRLESSEAVNGGAALVPDGAGAFRQADETNNGETGNAVANEDIGAGEWGEAYLSATNGVTL